MFSRAFTKTSAASSVNVANIASRAGITAGSVIAISFSVAASLARSLFWESPRRIEARRAIERRNEVKALNSELDDWDDVSDEDITQLNVPTGVPLLYEFDNDLQVTGSRYLGDPAKIEAATAAVAAQGKAK